MMFSPFFIEIDSITHKLWQKDTNASNNRQPTGSSWCGLDFGSDNCPLWCDCLSQPTTYGVRDVFYHAFRALGIAVQLEPKGLYQCSDSQPADILVPPSLASATVP